MNVAGSIRWSRLAARASQSELRTGHERPIRGTGESRRRAYATLLRKRWSAKPRHRAKPCPYLHASGGKTPGGLPFSVTVARNMGGEKHPLTLGCTTMKKAVVSTAALLASLIGNHGALAGGHHHGHGHEHHHGHHHGHGHAYGLHRHHHHYAGDEAPVIHVPLIPAPTIALPAPPSLPRLSLPVPPPLPGLPHP